METTWFTYRLFVPLLENFLVYIERVFLTQRVVADFLVSVSKF